MASLVRPSGDGNAYSHQAMAWINTDYQWNVAHQLNIMAQMIKILEIKPTPANAGQFVQWLMI